MGEPQSILGSCTGKATCLVNVWEVPEQEGRRGRWQKKLSATSEALGRVSYAWA